MSRIKNKVRKSLLTATVLFMAIFLFAGAAGILLIVIPFMKKRRGGD